MLLLKNNLKGFFFLFIFLPVFLLASNYFSIYNVKKSTFAFYIEKDNYKVVLLNAPKIDYLSYEGFKLFLPNYLKSFSLKILRYNSVGYINGYLSNGPYFNPKQVISNNPSELKYYFTDYRTDNKELDYILNGKIILYPNVTSLAIEAYHIPNIKKFGIPLYFTFLHSKKDNNLKYLIYSYAMVLNKKMVDKYVKSHFKILKYYKDRKFDYLYTYILNLDNTNKNKLKKIDKEKTKKSYNKKKVKFRLDVKRVFYMIDYPIEANRLKEADIRLDIKDIVYSIKDINESINSLNGYLKKKLTKKVLLFPKDIGKLISNHYSSLEELNKMLPIVKNISKKKCKLKCFFDERNISKRCFNKSEYFYKYVYFLGFKNKIPSEEEILGFGDYKVFNKIGIDYYHLGNIEKSKLYFYKAYALAPIEDRYIVAHNLASLYYLYDPYAKGVPEKVIKYLKESSNKLDIDKFNLGVSYYLGYGVKESDYNARKYFEEASKLGIEKSKYNLRIMDKFKIGLRN